MSLRRVWHLCNSQCVSVLFWLISFATSVFKSPSICFCEYVANLHSILWRRARLFDYNCLQAQCVARLSYLPSETALALLRESYTFFLETFLFFCINLIERIQRRKTITTGWDCVPRRPQCKYDWLSINPVGKTGGNTEHHDHVKLPRGRLT